MKLIDCESCKKKLDFSARVCPECGGKARRLRKQPWFWALVVAVSVLSSLASL